MIEWDKLVEEAQTAVRHAFEAGDEMADRIEQLVKERDESQAVAKIWQEDFIQENDRWCDASRKLDKAMEYLRKISRHANRSCAAIAAHALAELEGK
jgi:vacuolar-type H+-ATPase catalytic subunit A/Vma1